MVIKYPENLPLLKSLESNNILFWFSIFVEMKAKTLRIFLLSSCKRQLYHSLIETHWKKIPQQIRFIIV